MVLICYLSERRSEKLNGLINVRLIVQHVTETVFFVYHQTTSIEVFLVRIFLYLD